MAAETWGLRVVQNYKNRTEKMLHAETLRTDRKSEA